MFSNASDEREESENVSAGRPILQRMEVPHKSMLNSRVYSSRETKLKEQCEAAKEEHSDANPVERLGSCLAILETPDSGANGRPSCTKSIMMNFP